MIKYTVSIIIFALVACLFQQFLPTISGLYGARVLVFPLVFLCISITVEIPTMLGMAFLCGFLWDAQHSLGPQGGDPAIYTAPIKSIHFGYSIILYALMGFIMQGIRPLFKKGKWPISVFLTGIAIFLYLSAEYLLINFIRRDFTFYPSIISRIYITSFLTMICAPFVFIVLNWIARLCNHTIQYHGIPRISRLIHLDPDS